MKSTIYSIGNRKFYICKQQGWFWGIEDCYVSHDGRLNTALNGLTGNIGQTAEEVINRINDRVRLDALKAEGYTPEEALKILYNL